MAVNPDSPSTNPPHPPHGPGVVFVVSRPRRRGRTALCTCGWSGAEHRIWRALAFTDAWTHAAQTGCHPWSPLVVGSLPAHGTDTAITDHTNHFPC